MQNWKILKTDWLLIGVCFLKFLAEICNNCVLVDAQLNFFSLFNKKTPQFVCRFKKSLYLCTRFREAIICLPFRQDDPWKHSIQTSSTTWPLLCFTLSGEWSKVRNEKTNRQIYLIYFLIPASTDNLNKIPFF